MKLSINNNTLTIINERKNKIYGKEKNDSILIQKKSEKLESKNSSLDNTIKFSKSSSKIEDEGELGLDEVKHIIIYYKLNGETQKNYLFTKKDYNGGNGDRFACDETPNRGGSFPPTIF